MPQAESGIIALYGDSPRMKLLDYFMTFPKNEFTTPEIVKAVGMSRTTAFREISKLLDNEMILQTGNIGKSPLYKINIKSPIIYSMQKLTSHRSKKIATSQIKNQTLQKYLREQLDSVDKLHNRETMLKTELKLTRSMIKEIPV
ncbi:MAG: hypothetical protein MAG458_01151 [Nitrosopumilus sp.]|nr:hypothetical protein [Nitrosopumilus sp.]